MTARGWLAMGGVALVVTAGPALAHWTGVGSGSGSASSTTLLPPTAVAASASTGSVTWTASGAAGAAATSYLAERSAVSSPDDGARAWTSACSSAATSCTDTGLPTAAGTYRFVYRVTARLGTSWTAVSAESAVVTRTVAAAVSTPDLAAASDSGTSSTDDLTNVTTPVFTGTAAAGALVELLDGSTVVGAATATAAGTWSVQSSALAGGAGTAHVMRARATVGGSAVTSGSLTVTVDTLAPTVGAISVGANGAQSNGKPLSGVAATATVHPGALATVTAAATGAAAAQCSVTQPSATVNQSTGAWSGPSVSLERNQSCTATVTQQDAAGNTGSATATVVRG